MKVFKPHLDQCLMFPHWYRLLPCTVISTAEWHSFVEEVQAEERVMIIPMNWSDNHADCDDDGDEYDDGDGDDYYDKVAQATTSGKLGLRVCGFQRYSQTDGAFQKVTTTNPKSSWWKPQFEQNQFSLNITREGFTSLNATCQINSNVDNAPNQWVFKVK